MLLFMLLFFDARNLYLKFGQNRVGDRLNIVIVVVDIFIVVVVFPVFVVIIVVIDPRNLTLKFSQN